MKKLHLRTLFPAIIFSLCILELSFGLTVKFRVVWWFYLFCLFFIFNFKSVLANFNNLIIVNKSITILYFFSISIYIFHYFLSSYILYEVSTSDTINILWWSLFGFSLVILIKSQVVEYYLFWRYTYLIVFFGTVLGSVFGTIKYLNILSGRILPSYYYMDSLILGSSLNTDYNLYSIGLLTGAIFSFQVRKLYKGRVFNVFYLMCLFSIYLSSFISGSRRGFLLTIVVLFLGLFYDKLINGMWKRNIVTLGIVLISSFFLLTIYWENLIQLLENSGFIDSSIARIFSIKEDFSGENNRTIRFKWAYERLSELSINKLTFGGGFNYLSEMGVVFGDSKEDHPHNFILSTLLYGGVLALFTMLVLLYKMLLNTFINDKTLFFVLIILFFFSLSSANTLFSFRIFPTMVFLSTLQIKQFQKENTFR